MGLKYIEDGQEHQKKVTPLLELQTGMRSAVFHNLKESQDGVLGEMDMKANTAQYAIASLTAWLV